MATVMVWQDPVWVGYEAIFLARVENKLGVAITQASISSITYTTREADGAETQTGSGTLDKTTTIYDTLQTGGLWDADLTGYNFYGVLPGTCWPTAGKRYRVTIVITPSSGNPYPLVYEVPASRAS